MNLAFIGYGTITRIALETLVREAPGALETLVIVSRENGVERAHDLIGKLDAAIETKIAKQTRVVTDMPAALQWKPDLVVEAAGHGALQEHGAAALAAGVDLIVTSVGALSDKVLRGQLDDAATASGARYDIIPGAVGGLDILAAVKLSGLEKVLYKSRKPPGAWRGTAAEEMVDLGAIAQETVFFSGGAGDAARLFPQNANVAATIALKGAGFDATQVELIADPGVSKNVHELTVSGNSADFTIRIEGRPAPENPKTSLTTAYSLAQIVLEHMSRFGK
ncbi:MAG: aspartate dehydrogenase [Hyphomicrobiales bacterium]|nr:aspartate dehydrogenase [Hyphomicrobiales bacterium]